VRPATPGIPFGVCVVATLFAACSEPVLPMQPSVVSPSIPTVIAMEGEAGSGEGVVRQRSRASGGQTVHLAPGERRSWTFAIRATQTQYALAITYGNGQEGPNEIMHVGVDGHAVASFQNRDSGDAVEGWNLFVTDPAGTSMLESGLHTLTIETTGGDGCVEIDFVTVSPAGAAGGQ
jgi:hypothetical protein